MSGRTVWLFGGQGAEFPGMGLHLPAVHLDPLLEAASDVIGEDARRLLQRGGPRWAHTEVVQPLVVAVGLATAQVLGAHRAPDAFAGLSLGSLTAWAAAGGCAPIDAIRLAGARGAAMAGVPGGMVALEPDAPDPDGLSLAVVSPGEHVWAGPRDRVRAALATGGRALPVDGPWHTAALQPAADSFQRALAGVAVRPAPRWVGADALQAPEALVRDLSATVRWDRTLAAVGPVEHAVIVGPGRALASHVRRVWPDARCSTTDTAADLEALGA